MQCPFCGFENSRVLESRGTGEKAAIRRRRECENCRKRFTTYEKIEIMPVLIKKKNGAREEYSRKKLFSSIINACNKCDISISKMDEIIDGIELEMSLSSKREFEADIMGQRILDALKPLSEVAYLRYMSVFNKFQSLKDFKNEILKLDIKQKQY